MLVAGGHCRAEAVVHIFGQEVRAEQRQHAASSDGLNVKLLTVGHSARLP